MPKIKPAKDSEQKEKQVIKEIKPKDLTEFLEENKLELNWTVAGEARNLYYFKIKDFIILQDSLDDEPFERQCFPARNLDAAIMDACEELSLKGIQLVNPDRKGMSPLSFPVLSHNGRYKEEEKKIMAEINYLTPRDKIRKTIRILSETMEKQCVISCGMYGEVKLLVKDLKRYLEEKKC